MNRFIGRPPGCSRSAPPPARRRTGGHPDRPSKPAARRRQNGSPTGEACCITRALPRDSRRNARPAGPIPTAPFRRCRRRQAAPAACPWARGSRGRPGTGGGDGAGNGLAGPSGRVMPRAAMSAGRRRGATRAGASAPGSAGGIPAARVLRGDALDQRRCDRRRWRRRRRPGDRTGRRPPAPRPRGWRSRPVLGLPAGPVGAIAPGDGRLGSGPRPRGPGAPWRRARGSRRRP